MDKKEQEKVLDPTNWVRDYGDHLYRYTIKKVMLIEVAEDIVQETFLAALKGIDRFKGNSSEKTWLFAILKNKIVDYYRKKAKTIEDSTDFVMPFKENGLMFKHWEKGREPGMWEGSLSGIDDSDHFQRIFQYCLSLLPPKMASVFALKVIEECDSDEVCKELGISSSNFWVLMHRSRLQLRECIEKKIPAD